MLSAERERGGGGRKGFRHGRVCREGKLWLEKGRGGGGVDLNSKGEKGGIPAQEVEEPRGD